MLSNEIISISIHNGNFDIIMYANQFTPHFKKQLIMIIKQMFNDMYKQNN